MWQNPSEILLESYEGVYSWQAFPNSKNMVFNHCKPMEIKSWTPFPLYSKPKILQQLEKQSIITLSSINFFCNPIVNLINVDYI